MAPWLVPTPNQPPVLSIIIVNWNTRKLLAQCLQSVHDELEAAPEYYAETFVVDNASHDASVAMIRAQFPWVHLIENQENVGFARANNQAIDQSRGRYVLLLNSDTRVKPGALRALIEFMETHPETGAAGSMLLNADETLQTSCYPRPTLAREFWRLFHLDKLRPYAVYRMERWPLTVAREVDIVQGASLIVRRAVLDQVGVLDPDYFIYSEEVDLCRRIKRSGWSMHWVPQSAVIHYGGQSTRQVAAKMFLNLYRYKVLYFRKNHGEMTTQLYKIILMLATLTRIGVAPVAWLTQPTQRAHHTQMLRNYGRLLLTLPSL